MLNLSGKFVLRVPGSLHRNLSQEAKRRGYSLNSLCVQLLENGLKSENSVPSKKTGAELLPILKKKFKDDFLGLLVFGSRVTGQATSSSDTDFLIVLSQTLPLSRSLYHWWDNEVTASQGAIWNPQFVHLPESPQQAGKLWYEAAMAHNMIWEKSRQISEPINHLINAMADGQLNRRWSHGNPYWIWKEKTGSFHNNLTGYIIRAGHRLAAVEVLLARNSYADVVRESQELVELCLKGLLRISHIEVPRTHDVSGLLLEFSSQLPASVKPHAAELAKISKQLRRDRELSFYGSEDLTPSEFYTSEEAKSAFENAKWVHSVCKAAV